MMKDSILIQAWSVYKFKEDYYIEYSQAIYLYTIKKKYKQIYLVCPTHIINEDTISNYKKIDCRNITIYELPPFSSYATSYKNFFRYLQLYRSLKNDRFDTIYSRFPNPFGWLQMFFFKENRVVHFVGDPIDTVLKNKDINIFYRYLKVAFFIPEYSMFLISSYKADKVFSNGMHISRKLSRYGISIKPLISSTLTDNDFYYKNKDNVLQLDDEHIKLIYVGYLRKAKGVSVLIEALKELNHRFPGKFSLTIVGSGEEEVRLSKRAEELNLPVFFEGHIDDRDQLNNIMRKHDIFCFPSISEGSPRVVLEAIANGLFVITTPVGSLPYIFEEYKDILFFDFNSQELLVKKIIELCENTKLQNSLRENSFTKVKSFKIDNFINEAFSA